MVASCGGRIRFYSLLGQVGVLDAWIRWCSYQVTINPADPRPPYQQLADELRAAIASGELGPGDPLPSVRDLAARYRVSNTTASRAIESLKAEGLVDTRPGRGNIVRSKRPVLYVGSYLSAD